MSELAGRGSSGERRASVATSTPRPWLMLGIVFAWGTCFVAIRWGLRYAPPLWFATLRAALAGGLLVAVGVLRGGRLPRSRSAWLVLLALGIVNVAFAFGAMFAGVANVNATGVAAVLANAQPLLILLPAWVFYGERASPTAVVGVAVGFAGLLFIAIPGGGGTGAWLSLLSAGSITAGTLLARRLAGVDLIMATGIQFVIGGLLLGGFSEAAEGAPAINWTDAFLAVVLLLAVLGTALPYLAWFAELRRAPLGALTAWTLLVPVVGVLAGAIALGEVPGVWTGIGLGLVLLTLPTAVGLIKLPLDRVPRRNGATQLITGSPSGGGLDDGRRRDRTRF